MTDSKELIGWKPFKPPEGTVPTLIHDIYGEGVLAYFPKGDTQSPCNLEIGMRSAQLGVTVEEYKAILEEAKS